MDRSAVKKIVDREIEPLKERLGIPHWRVKVAYDLRKSTDGWTTPGRCEIKVDYNKAWIELDPDAFEDRQEVLSTLRHELFHVVIHPFELLCHIIKPAIERDQSVVEVLQEVRIHAAEQLVINLERMYRGLTKETTMKKSSPKPSTPKATAKAAPKSSMPKAGKKAGGKMPKGGMGSGKGC